MENWPPATAPPWPPPAISSTWFSTSNLGAFLRRLRREQYGILISHPTPTEEAQVFDIVTCDCGASVTGYIFVSDSVRYFFAICNNPVHKQFLCPWPPYGCGHLSGDFVVIEP